MAKKVILKDLDNVEILPITRGELIVDSSGKEAFHSNEFLATNSLPGLMSPEEKTKLSNIEGNTIDSTLSTTSTNPVQNKVVTVAINETKQLANDALKTANEASENISKVQQIINSIKENYLKSATVNGNVLTIVDLSDSEITFTNTTYNTFLKETAANTGGRNGLVPKPNYNDGSKTRFLREDGTWVIPTNTSYTFANGTDGSFTVTPSGGSGQKVTIGKPATAGTADKVAKSLTLKIKTGTTEGTDLYTYNGSLAKTLDIKAGANITLTPTAGVLTISATNSNTTYTLSGALDGNTFVTTLTPSSGTATTAIVPVMVGATSSAAGKAGLVPAPATNKHTSFLRGDGTWATPPDTHWTTHLYVGAKDAASNALTTNGNTYIKIADNSTIRNQYIIKGSGITAVASDANGNITINTPASHNLPTSDINKLTGYAIATLAAVLATTDTLNVALGKLEYKLNIAYDLVTKANDSDGTIENLKEILDVLAGIKDTETIKALVGKYLPLAGGTMTLGEGLKFHADENYFGTNLDARIISLLDGNGTTCDGGLIIDERCTSNGTTTVTELLRIRDTEFKWKGLNILHSGNSSVTKSGQTLTVTINETSQSLTNSTYNFSGTSFTSGNQNTAEHNANNITSNGVWYYTSNGPTTSLGASTNDGALYSQAYNSNWVGQIAQDYRDGDLFTRGRNNGTWSDWKRVAYANDIPTVTDYYWANVKVSSSSSTATTPTFAVATATTSVTTPLVTSSSVLTLNGVSGVNLKYNNSNEVAIVLSSTYFKPFEAANNKLSLGTSSARWSNIYSVLGNFSGLITATSGVLIGGTADIGWYLYNNRICAGSSTARNVNVGSLLVSNAWADSSKVPTNGIYSKGNVSAAGFVKTNSSDSYVLLGGGGHKTISSIITSGYIGTTLVLTSSKAQALSGISSINGRLSISAENDLTRLGFGGVHSVVFGESGYAHRGYYFRPSYSASGATNTGVYIQNASAADSPTWTTTHAFYSDGNVTHTGSVTAYGFKKNGSSDSYILLGGGGHKALSDFMLKSEILTNNLTTISKSLTVTLNWMDTGIKYQDLPSTGTYVVLVYTHMINNSVWYGYWSGLMSWYRDSTNSSESDEILLHRTSHAMNGNTIYLRTITTASSDGRHLRLLIAANKDLAVATYTFKFKRII